MFERNSKLKDSAFQIMPCISSKNLLIDMHKGQANYEIPSLIYVLGYPTVYPQMQINRTRQKQWRCLCPDITDDTWNMFFVSINCALYWNLSYLIVTATYNCKLLFSRNENSIETLCTKYEETSCCWLPKQVWTIILLSLRSDKLVEKCCIRQCLGVLKC